MSSQADIIMRVREFATNNRIRPARLAKMADLHPNTLRDIQSDEWNPRLTTLLALEGAIAEFIHSQGQTQPANGSQIKGSIP